MCAHVGREIGVKSGSAITALNQGRADESVAEVDDGFGDFSPPTAEILFADLTL